LADRHPRRRGHLYANARLTHEQPDRGVILYPAKGGFRISVRRLFPFLTCPLCCTSFPQRRAWRRV